MLAVLYIEDHAVPSDDVSFRIVPRLLPKATPPEHAVCTLDPPFDFLGSPGSHDAPPFTGEMLEIVRVEETVKILAGNVGKRQADVFEEMLIGEVQHSVRCCRPSHCRDHVNDLVSVYWVFQVDPPAARNAGTDLKILRSSILS
ncbi:hypothetical protein AGR4C_pb20105 [Agrobacterium tumefaciens str. Kerr 14]|uniref:Uncharacterized protein n=1 Tax=Agrobacterium tumefaciens str. Kerr 14 TaxID=1183424 RepID=A0A1S7SDN9_AGRTU|nr:hypothetical protein AGR4C_pb20105 [Agrobacterium tumefaciens str. Kerr 14]